MDHRVATSGHIDDRYDYLVVFVEEDEALTAEHARSLAANYFMFDCEEAWKYGDAEEVTLKHRVGPGGSDEWVVTYRLTESLDYPVWVRERDLPW